MDTLDQYRQALKHAPLSDGSKRVYLSKVTAYLDWLASSDLDGDPLLDAAARDWAMRDYRSKLKMDKRSVSTINTTLAALDDFYRTLGLGPGVVKREPTPQLAPRSLSPTDRKRVLRALEQAKSRDRLIGLIGLYQGLRAGEIVALDVKDISMTARLGTVTVWHGKGDKSRVLPLHAEIRKPLTAWLQERKDNGNPALLINRNGERLSTRSVNTIIGEIGESAGLEEPLTPHRLRHTFATDLIRGGSDPVLVSDLLGHNGLQSVMRYSLPSHQDRVAALERLPVDL